MSNFVAIFSLILIVGVTFTSIFVPVEITKEITIAPTLSEITTSTPTTDAPTLEPTLEPTGTPSLAPSLRPSNSPSLAPTLSPVPATDSPSLTPTMSPETCGDCCTAGPYEGDDPPYAYGGPEIDPIIKPNTIWDPTKYFNIWVIEFSGGTLGYAQFPSSSGLSGLPGGGAANTFGLYF